MGVLGYAVLGYPVLGQADSGGAVTPGASLSSPDGLTSRVRYVVGDTIPVTWHVTHDVDGTATYVTPTTATATVTHDSGVTVDVTASLSEVDTGVFVVGWVPAIAGRVVVTLTTTGPGAGVTEVVVDVNPLNLALFTVDQLRDYLGATSAGDDEVWSAFVAERAAQAQRCRVDPFTHELREALMRRVARNLAARSVPVATFTSFDGGATSTRVPSVDAEVRRLEAAYRRLPVG